MKTLYKKSLILYKNPHYKPLPTVDSPNLITKKKSMKLLDSHTQNPNMKTTIKRMREKCELCVCVCCFSLMRNKHTHTHNRYILYSEQTNQNTYRIQVISNRNITRASICNIRRRKNEPRSTSIKTCTFGPYEKIT